ncbi:capsular biosynthesis protein, partial [Leptolyngbya sp. FACHB-36]|uniref:Wzz/FepE/Etk N-terminal domain-containing protein n=1 Tax=Leptolyngbya sp. FACHB-36 TaxID=2692808 RepID=UPI00199590F9
METNRNSQLSATDSNGRFLMPPQPAPTVENDEETFDLGRLGSVVRRRIGLVSGVALGTIAAGTGLLFFMDETTPAQYAGKFQILVEPVTAEDKLAKLSTQAQGGETQGGPQQIDVEQSSLDYETQILVLQSRKLMDPVVKEIQKKYPHITYEFLIGSGKLSVSRVSAMVNRTRQETKMIEVWYQDSDPEQV